MENASKALIIAAEILIGVILLTLLVYAFYSMASFSKSVNENIDVKNISEFNAQFEIYNGRTNLTAQDVITLGNLAKEYNKTAEGQLNNITVYLQGAGSYHNIQSLDNAKTYEFIKDYSIEKQAIFECSDITYNANTKKIQKMTLKLVQ